MMTDDVLVRHIDWIARLAFRFHRCKDDAEDLAQETLCRIYANRDKYNSARDFKPWALTIMSNIHKTQHARKECVPFVGYDSSYDAIASTRADDRARYNDVINTIHRSASESVGVECVVLYAQGYSYDEIADIVGINPGTVKSRIYSGRRHIRQALES